MFYRKLPAFIAHVIFGFTLLVWVENCACANRAKEPITNITKAEKLADSKFKKFTHGTIRNFSRRLIEQNAEEWVFSYDDNESIPRPGSTIFVTVQKSSGRVTINYGK
jgi:hypothetical protein